MMWLLIIPLYCYANVPQVQKIEVTSVNEAIRANMTPNFSFEDIQDGVPTGWRWDRRNTDATLTIDEEQSHTGRRSIKIRNGTSFGAHVYGSLWVDPPIPVKPKTRYTLSFYALSDLPGAAWIGGGQGWRIRKSISPTNGKWQRFSTSFTTGADETTFSVRINTDSPTTGFWVDDIKLEEGDSATFCEPPPNHTRIIVSPRNWPTAMSDGPWNGIFDIYMPEMRRTYIRTILTQGEYSSECDKAARLQKGVYQVRIGGKAIDSTDETCTISLQLFYYENLISPLAETSVQTRFLSAPNAQKRLEKLLEESAKLKQMAEQVREKGVDISYPMVGITVITNFVQYVQGDLERGEIERVFDQLNQMEDIARSVRGQLQSVIDDKASLPEVPRYATSSIDIEGPSFIADTHFPISGVSERRPVFFTGYGHFGQVRDDLEKFPGYGTNIIQIEFGPRSIFPEEDEVSDSVIQTYLRDFDRAAKAGVSVNLLISPHYMPGWMMEKYPQLNIKKEGFLRYCLHVPEGQEFLKRFIRHAIPLIKDHPALHSICLANEPVNAVPPECTYAQELWHSWLKERHTDIETLNKLWKTKYESFDDIPIEPLVKPTPISYEFVLFNQEWFAGWHGMLSDTIRDIAPDLPIHTKAMTWNFFSAQDQRFGVNAELFAGFSQIQGNDSVNMYSHGLGEWAQLWQLNNMGHDLQRSVGDMPVFNSENHIIRDRETRHIPAGHVRTALWQAAIHGQSATTIWVWARTYDPKSDFAGSIMHRPACAEAVGRTGLDLQRLSEEVRALQTLPPQVALLYSTSAMVYDGGEYTDCMRRLYTALSFTGLKLGFVTERQLAYGVGNRPPILLIPNIRHLSAEGFAALKDYPGKVVLVGDDSILYWDSYHNPRKNKLDYERIEFSRDHTEAQDLWKNLLDKLPIWNVAPKACVLDDNRKPVWGVEWLVAEHKGQQVVNLIQHATKPVKVALYVNEEPFNGIDMFTQEDIAGKLELKPLEPKILKGK